MPFHKFVSILGFFIEWNLYLEANLFPIIIIIIKYLAVTFVIIIIIHNYLSRTDVSKHWMIIYIISNEKYITKDVTVLYSQYLTAARVETNIENS